MQETTDDELCRHLRKTTAAAVVMFVFFTLPARAESGWSASDPLMPTGISSIDTENLQAALHDSRLSSGGTLYLGPGTFKIHRFIGRQNLDPYAPSHSTVLFNGTIRGAGKGVTVIKGVRGPGGEGFEPISYLWPGDPEPTRDHTLLGVVQVYLGVKELTFDSEPELVEAGGGVHTGLLNYVGTGSLFQGHNQLIGTDIIDVHFKGSLSPSGEPETFHLFQQFGDQGGVHNITGCDFENSIVFPVDFAYLSDATINVGGKPNERVTFANHVLPMAVALRQCGNCTANVSHIETDDAGLLLFRSGPSNVSSAVTVTFSEINARPGSSYAGIELWGGSGDLSVAITNNNIHSEDSFFWGPIFSDAAMQNAVIMNNKITGRGPAAMYLGALYWHPGTVTAVGNNLEGWETTPSPWGFTAAPVWLGPFIVNSVVVGGQNQVNIFDEPAYDTNWNPLYDGNGEPLTVPGYGALVPPEEFDNLVPKGNVFTGLNNMGMNLGQDVREALQQKAEAKFH